MGGVQPLPELVEHVAAQMEHPRDVAAVMRVLRAGYEAGRVHLWRTMRMTMWTQDRVIDYAEACSMLFEPTARRPHNVIVWPSITITRICSWIELRGYTAHTDRLACSWDAHEWVRLGFQHCAACSEFMTKLFPAYADVFRA